jgi:tRNA pseudouridine55 synthase
MKEGIVIINKPTGLTSHDIVKQVRKTLGVKKVGHAGTLDPLATGVLIILVGKKATKLADTFITLGKAYRSTLLLGTKTDSADTDGKIVLERPYNNVSQEKIKEAFKKYEGEIQQKPPMFSAIKINGKRLYKSARKGIEVERKARTVHVNRLDVEEINFPKVKFYMECSKGTYVRQIADDVGEDLGCGACICQLQRTKVGDFTLENAIEIGDLNESCIRDC